jgi:16S rRNA (cytosine1402-N4)-methyltransferase
MDKADYSLHIPVLLDEVLVNLAIKDGGRYLDCTFGAGGYSKAILQAGDVELCSLDRDPLAKELAEQVKAQFLDRFTFKDGNFADVATIFPEQKFDGIVLDLGVSSMQLDQAGRGFSFMHDGPLDMRMSQEGHDAAYLVANASEKELADIIYWYGEEVQSRAIARNIVQHRQRAPITTTYELANIVREAMHYRPGKIDPVTKTFQALRIFVNQELQALEQFLAQLEGMLNDNGRILVVSFHALEDRIVKKFFKDHAAKKVSKSKYSNMPQEAVDAAHWLNSLTKKPIVPSRQEVVRNPRSRSARMRVAEKLARG